MAIKIDLEKAYDRLRWDFLEHVLEEAGFDHKFICLIMDCVTSVSYNIFWNGNTTEYFQAKRGLRQGDPISPLLFVLCIDKLSHLICDEVNQTNWKPNLVSKQGPAISHLMFTDDLLLFGEAMVQQSTCMMNCLQKFCEASGEKISFSKSTIFFSPKVKPDLKQRIEGITKMKISSEIGRYLGFPLSRKRRTKDTFQYIVDKVRLKLSTWKGKCLSTAGRITLAKSVLAAVPIYPMQIASIPVAICNEVERIQRSFIWGHGVSTHGYHPIGWNQLLLPKIKGGLGLKRLSSLNKACGAKTVWRLINGTNGLWAEVLLHKYMIRDEDELLNVQKGDSTLWKFLVQQRDLITKGSKWIIRNGCNVQFFNDTWLLKDKPLVSSCLRNLSATKAEIKVMEWVSNGSWDLTRLTDILPCQVIHKLITMMPPRLEAGEDVLAWSGTNSGMFTVKSAYELLEESTGRADETLFKHIWKWQGAERVRVFMWIALQGRLPTNLWRSRWSNADPIFAYCNQENESSLHVLRDCDYARRMWKQLISPKFLNQFFVASLKDWGRLNLMRDLGLHGNGNWHLLWGVAIWKLWSWRNNEIFQQGFVKPKFPEIAVNFSWTSFVQIQEANVTDTVSSKAVGWVPPANGWVKVNIDGAATRSECRVGCGGVIRNHGGEWIAGFTHYLGSCSAFEAEQWALAKGLNLAWELGFRQVMVESDAKELVEILDDDPAQVSGSLVFQRIKEFMSRSWNLVINFVSRDMNDLAVRLAKKGLMSYVFLDACPEDLRTVLSHDNLGLNSPLYLV